MSDHDGDDALTRALSRLGRDERFKEVLARPEAFRFQCLLTECDDIPSTSARRQGYRANEEYFYPASTIKLVVAAAALHVTRRLAEESDGGLLARGLKLTTPLRFHYRHRSVGDAGTPGDGDGVEGESHAIFVDETNKSGKRITLAHLIRNVFLVSSNGAYNLLLDFVGRGTLNALLTTALGFEHFKIDHYLQDDRFGPQPDRVGGFLGIEADLGPAGHLGIKCGDSLVPLIKGRAVCDPGRPRPAPLFTDFLVGEKHVSEWDHRPASGEVGAREGGEGGNGGLIGEPKSFEAKNRASLVELQDFLMVVLGWPLPGRPPSGGGNGTPVRRAFAEDLLNHAERAFLSQAMGTRTTEAFNPEYGEDEYASDWNKFFLSGVAKVSVNSCFGSTQSSDLTPLFSFSLRFGASRPLQFTTSWARPTDSAWTTLAFLTGRRGGPSFLRLWCTPTPMGF